MKYNKVSLPLQCVILVLFLIISFFIQKKLDLRMSDNWVSPYLSASKNLTFGGDFMINIDEVKKYKSLSVSEQDAYRFTRTDNLELYNTLGQDSVIQC